MTMLLLTSGCMKNESSNSGVATEEYNELVEKYNARVNEMSETTSALKNTMRRFSAVDRKMSDTLQLANQLDLQITNQASARALTTAMQSLKSSVDATLDEIAKLETSISTELKTAQHTAIAGWATEETTEFTQYTFDLAGYGLAELDGMRGILLKLKDNYEFKLELLADSDAELRESLAAASSPVVSSRTEGGRITGVARDSVTGRALVNAIVGFKTRQNSSDYFHQTRTGLNGEYTSPYLRPGSYYVDIQSNGYVAVQASGIVVQASRETEENISMTRPVQNARFRITVSWGGEGHNRVRDVDSYLKIPGVSEPLHFNMQGQEYHGAYLDRDDTNWIGPETTTIKVLRRGEYVFSVNNYNIPNSSTALGNSAVRVRVYQGDRMTHNFSVPQGNGITYEVFRISNGVLRATGTFSTRSPIPQSRSVP